MMSFASIGGQGTKSENTRGRRGYAAAAAAAAAAAVAVEAVAARGGGGGDRNGGEGGDGRVSGAIGNGISTNATLGSNGSVRWRVWRIVGRVFPTCGETRIIASKKACRSYV